MNANKQFDEDDLVLYALRLLRESEDAAVADWVTTDQQARSRLADFQLALGLYAESEVRPTELPEGSRQRLLDRVAAERSGEIKKGRAPRPPVALPTQNEVAAGRPYRFGWPGWAVAAVLAIALGLSMQQWFALRQKSVEQAGQVAALSAEAAGLRGERATMKARLEEQAGTAQQLAAEARASSKDANALQSRLASQTASRNEQAARAAEAERERGNLQQALAAQNDELAQLSAETKNAEVLAALTDPTALRVVLTRPKSKPVPTGRAAYVANKGTLVFLGSNLLPLKAAKVYELWILPADGASPIPAGTFLPDAKGNATLAYARFPRAVPAKGFAVTIEDAGGAQAPTLPLILAGS